MVKVYFLLTNVSLNILRVNIAPENELTTYCALNMIQGFSSNVQLRRETTSNHLS